MENYEQKQIVLFRKYAFGGVTKQDMLLTEGYNIEGFLLRKSSFRECYKTSYVTTRESYCRLYGMSQSKYILNRHYFSI